jgi:hypothetical protein
MRGQMCQLAASAKVEDKKKISLLAGLFAVPSQHNRAGFVPTSNCAMVAASAKAN